MSRRRGVNSSHAKREESAKRAAELADPEEKQPEQLSRSLRTSTKCPECRGVFSRSELTEHVLACGSSSGPSRARSPNKAKSPAKARAKPPPPRDEVKSEPTSPSAPRTRRRSSRRVSNAVETEQSEQQPDLAVAVEPMDVAGYEEVGEEQLIVEQASPGGEARRINKMHELDTSYEAGPKTPKTFKCGGCRQELSRPKYYKHRSLGCTHNNTYDAIIASSQERYRQRVDDQLDALAEDGFFEDESDTGKENGPKKRGRGRPRLADVDYIVSGNKKTHLFCDGCEQLLPKTNWYVHRKAGCSKECTYYELRAKEGNRSASYGWECSFPDCNARLLGQDKVVDHVVKRHGVIASVLSREIRDDEFEEFKQELLMRGSIFVRTGQSVNGGVHIDYYRCQLMRKTNRNRPTPNKQFSNKLPVGCICTAFMKVFHIGDGKMKIIYCEDHLHELEIRRFRVPTEVKQRILDLFRAGYMSHEVLHTIHEQARDGPDAGAITQRILAMDIHEIRSLRSTFGFPVDRAVLAGRKHAMDGGAYADYYDEEEVVYADETDEVGEVVVDVDGDETAAVGEGGRLGVGGHAVMDHVMYDAPGDVLAEEVVVTEEVLDEVGPSPPLKRGRKRAQKHASPPPPHSAADPVDVVGGGDGAVTSAATTTLGEVLLDMVDAPAEEGEEAGASGSSPKRSRRSIVAEGAPVPHQSAEKTARRSFLWSRVSDLWNMVSTENPYVHRLLDNEPLLEQLHALMDDCVPHKFRV